MTKSKQIMALYDGNRTTAEIAAIVGCRDSYVRVVARQRRGKGLSEIDRRYYATPSGQQKKADYYDRARAAYNGYANAWHAEYRRSGDREKARAAGRAAYHKAKQS